MFHDYWQRQEPDKPLFPDIEWGKPEQRVHAGRLAIIGGSKSGFAAVVAAHDEALRSGIGQTRTLLPDSLHRMLPKPLHPDIIFLPTNMSGGFSKEAEPELKAAWQWAQTALLIGDSGRNSETAILFESLLHDYDTPVVMTRDAIDLLKNASQSIVERPQTVLVMSFAQLQKLFQAVYYPKVLTFSMQLAQLVEALHKFTLTYPVTIAVLHAQTLLVAFDGAVVTTPWENAMAIWRGAVATRMATYWTWYPQQPLQAIATSIVTI